VPLTITNPLTPVPKRHVSASTGFQTHSPLPLCHTHHTVAFMQHTSDMMLRCNTPILTLVCLKRHESRHTEPTVVRCIVNTVHRSMSSINYDVSEKPQYQTHCALQHRALRVATLPRHAQPLCLAYHAHARAVCVPRLAWGAPPLPSPEVTFPLPHRLETASLRACASHAFGTYQPCTNAMRLNLRL
jgi:hypothetical protein